MKPILLLLVSATCFKTASSQLLINDSKSRLLNSSTIAFSGSMIVNNYRTVEVSQGSLYFQNEWANAKIITENLTIHYNVPVKIDLMANEVLYLDSTGKELVLTTPVRQLSFTEKSTGKDVNFVSGEMLPNKKSGWFQVLLDDSISLVKAFRKTVNERFSYGGEKEFNVTTEEYFYLYLKDKEFEIKKPTDFIKAFPSRKRQIQAYIKTLDKKGSKEAQFKAVAGYCNLFFLPERVGKKSSKDSPRS